MVYKEFINRVFPINIIKKIYIWMVILIIIFNLIISVFVIISFYNSIIEERSREMLAAVKKLEERLPGSFDDILKAVDLLTASDKEQTLGINKTLQPIINDLSTFYPNLTIGYFSIDQDHIVAMGPDFDLLMTTPRTFHNLKPYDTEVLILGHFRTFIGWVENSTYNVTYPIIRDGSTIGYAWASTRTDDIYHLIFDHLQFTFFIGMAVIIMLFVVLWKVSNKFSQDLQEFAVALSDESGDITVKVMPEFNTVLKALNDNKEKLQTNAVQFEQLVELLPDPLILYSKGKIIFANSSAYSLYDIRPNGLEGKDFLDFIYIEDREKIKTLIEQVEKEKITIPYFKAVQLTEKGEPIEVEMSLVHFLYLDISATQILLRDIKKREKLEEELSKASKMESLSVLAGGIAHDFNNLLTIIWGNVALGKLKIPDELKDNLGGFLEEIEKATLQAKDLTGPLMDFAKGSEPIRKPVDIGELVRETVKLILVGSNAKGEFFISNGLPIIEVDEGQIRQVINNIGINALQAMPDGGTLMIKVDSIAILAKQYERTLPLHNGDYIKIEITDVGIGMTTEILSRIFDPYYTTKEHGNGLGLASAYSIIKNHNGYIDVESKIGLGTSFFIYLPITHLSKNMVFKEVEKIYYLYSKDKAKKVLFMDDGESLRKTVKNILGEAGYEVVCASNGNEIISMFEKALESNKPFDAVIMDLTVPGGMGGKTTMSVLLDKYPDVKAIVSSGYPNDPVMIEYERFGFKGTITKPYDPKVLLSLLNRVIYDEN